VIQDSKTLGAILLTLIISGLSACASEAAVEETLRVDPINVSNPAIRQASTLGIYGADWGENVFCDDTGACTILGRIMDFVKANRRGTLGESTDYLAIRLDKNGSPIWARSYGGTNEDRLENAFASADGGFLLFGESSSLFYTPMKITGVGRSKRPLIVKVNHDGELQWAKLVEEVPSRFFVATQSVDGGFILVGYHDHSSGPSTNSQACMLVLKLASDGRPLWLHDYYLGAGYSNADSVSMGKDGTIVIAGDYGVGDVEGLLLMTLSPDGDPIQILQYPHEGREMPITVSQRDDGEIVVAGEYLNGKTEDSAFVQWLDDRGTPKQGFIYSPANDDGFTIFRGMSTKAGIVLVGRSGPFAGENAEVGSKAVALSVGNDGKVTSFVSVSGTRKDSKAPQSEFTGIAPITSGDFVLAGATDAYGAPFVDVLAATWIPSSAQASAISTASFNLGLPIPAKAVISGLVKVVDDVPVSDILTVEIRPQ
jgi:hypothetical protein